jgi:hypothetical protein
MLGAHKIGDPYVCKKCSKVFWFSGGFYAHKKKCGIKESEQVFISVSMKAVEYYYIISSCSPKNFL